jgi:hypothetical protein
MKRLIRWLLSQIRSAPPLERGRRIVIMSRTNPDDLIGEILSPGAEPLEPLRLPPSGDCLVIDDPSRRAPTPGEEAERRKRQLEWYNAVILRGKS